MDCAVLLDKQILPKGGQRVDLFPIAVALTCAVAAIIYGAILVLWIIRRPAGDVEMQRIALAIQEGSRAYLNRQSVTISFVAGALFILLFVSLGWKTALGFLVGALASAAAGYVGMLVGVYANVRTAEAAKEGAQAALTVAFRGGSVTGFLVVGLGLLGAAGFWGFTNDIGAMVGLAFGGSLISIFARVGGGIYTKAADVGADLVGKVEVGIPEDDARNPAVIADNVGDNVGDNAGMAADLFETYVVTVIAAMLLGHFSLADFGPALSYPLALGAVGILASMTGTLFVRLGEGRNIIGALYKGVFASALLAAVVFYPVTTYMMSGNGEYSALNIYLSALVGLMVTAGMMVITNYYTSSRYLPVLSIAKASVTGHATNIITGWAVGLRSTALPALVIAIGIVVAFGLAGLYGVGIAAVSMLSMAGIVVAVDSFGPITDNAGGIAEMAGLPSGVREVTDALDAVGNTTKAVTKGYAIGSAGLAAIVLFSSFTKELELAGIQVAFVLSDPYVLVGLFVGSLLPYLFGALVLDAVSKSAAAVVEEVRRQFREIHGLMSGKARPEYGHCVSLVTGAAQKKMLLPGLIPVVTPIAIGAVGFVVGRGVGPKILGAVLVGSIITGLFEAIFMTSGGAAWDNAKKYIEEGNYGGKGSFAHEAAVTGDTVGDPSKDAAGPAINPMIKVLNIVALLIVPFLR